MLRKEKYYYIEYWSFKLYFYEVSIKFKSSISKYKINIKSDKLKINYL